MSLLHGLGSLVLRRDRELMTPALERGEGDVVRRAAPLTVPLTDTASGPDILQPGLVKNMIDRMDAIPEQTRLGTSHYIHVSALVDLCPRQYYLAHEHGTEDYRDHLGQRFTGGHLVTFALGRAVDAYVKERVVGATQRRGMFGLWTCRCGRSRRTGMYVPTLCETCELDTDVYNEPVLRNEEYCITGRPDVTLVDSNDHLLPIEVKSMARDRWTALDAPLADHVLQALLYRWLYECEGRRVHTHVIILYVAKEFRYGSPYKEFHVDAMSDINLNILRLALHLAAQIRDARNTSTPPARVLCSDATCARARNCPVQALCFNME